MSGCWLRSDPIVITFVISVGSLSPGAYLDTASRTVLDNQTLIRRIHTSADDSDQIFMLQVFYLKQFQKSMYLLPISRLNAVLLGSFRATTPFHAVSQACAFA